MSQWIATSSYGFLNSSFEQSAGGGSSRQEPVLALVEQQLDRPKVLTWVKTEARDGPGYLRWRRFGRNRWMQAGNGFGLG